MSRSNINGRDNQRQVEPDWFTGSVWLKSVMSSSDQDIYHVHFEDGARTKLHRHNGNQVLIVTAGTGSLQTFEQSDQDSSKIQRTDTTDLTVGDIVHIPAGTLHTHGSTDRTATFSHIALNIIPKDDSTYKTTWYESDFESSIFKII